MESTVCHESENDDISCLVVLFSYFRLIATLRLANTSTTAFHCAISLLIVDIVDSADDDVSNIFDIVLVCNFFDSRRCVRKELSENDLFAVIRYKEIRFLACVRERLCPSIYSFNVFVALFSDDKSKCNKRPDHAVNA